VEGTGEFEEWFDNLAEDERGAVIHVVDMLQESGPALGFPWSTKIKSSRHSHMRELRIQHDCRPLRVLYAFDPRRSAILLLGGDKTGDARWYQHNVPIADRLYDAYLRELEEEGLT
jgi:hypothetical protein